VDHLPGDVSRFVARQEMYDGGDLGRRAEPAERNALEQRRLHRFGELTGHVGFDEARGDRVDGDRAAADLARERARQRLEPALAGGVVRLPGVAQLGDYGR